MTSGSEDASPSGQQPGIRSAAGQKPSAEFSPSGMERRLVDFSTPSSARMYNYLLGGKDNFQVDRDAADKIVKDFPDARRVAGQNRAFGLRAARFMAEGGIRQWLDLGSGLPAEPNLHEVVLRIDPGCRVVYVDNDPIVLTHRGALLAGDNARISVADVTDPDAVFADPHARELLDLSEPVGLMLVSVGHFIGEGLGQLLAFYRDRVPSGSYLALSHVTDAGAAAEKTTRAEQTYESAGGLTFRSPEEIELLFAGWDLVDSVVPVAQWRPELHEDTEATQPVMLAGVAMKP